MRDPNGSRRGSDDAPGVHPHPVESVFAACQDEVANHPTSKTTSPVSHLDRQTASAKPERRPAGRLHGRLRGGFSSPRNVILAPKKPTAVAEQSMAEQTRIAAIAHSFHRPRLASSTAHLPSRDACC